MRRLTHQNIPVPVIALARRLEAYRRKPRRRRKLPEKLWSEAARQAAEHGVCRVQQALQLNYVDLKRRTEAFLNEAAPKAGAAFVELRVPSTSAVPGMAVLELEGGGRKLTLRLGTEDSTKLAAAVSALWGCGS